MTPRPRPNFLAVLASAVMILALVLAVQGWLGGTEPGHVVPYTPLPPLDTTTSLSTPGGPRPPEPWPINPPSPTTTPPPINLSPPPIDTDGHQDDDHHRRGKNDEHDHHLLRND